MKTAIIIPARYASTRLPGKPLLRETGKYLVQHVYEQACQVRNVATVAVATDDTRIAAAVESFGGRIIMTRRNHPTGTDRVAEAARILDADVILNVQGDEPFVEPASLELLIQLLQRNAEAEMATLAVPFTSVEHWQNPNCVKVVHDSQGRALYFSRSPIPHVRDGQPDLKARPARFLLHLGVYAYRKRFLQDLAALPPQPLEQLEKLEQLRVLALGRQIQVGVMEHAGIGVDTYDDYLQFVAQYRARNRRKTAA